MEHNNLLQEAESRISAQNEEVEFVEMLLGKKSTLLSSLSNVQKKEYIKNTLSLIETLRPNEQFVIKNRFGLCGCKKTTLAACGSILQVSRERVRMIETSAISRLKKLVAEKEKLKQLDGVEYLSDYANITLAEMGLSNHHQYIFVKNNINSCSELLNFYFQNGDYGLKAILGESSFRHALPLILKFEGYETAKAKHEKKMKELVENGESKSVLLGNFNFSVRTYNVLMRNGYRNLQDLIDTYKKLGFDVFLKLKNMGRDGVMEIVKAVEKYVDLKEINHAEITKENAKISLEEINLPLRIYNALRRSGYKTLKEVLELYAIKGEVGLSNIEGLGNKLVKELKQILDNYLDTTTLENNV